MWSGSERVSAGSRTAVQPAAGERVAVSWREVGLWRLRSLEALLGCGITVGMPLSKLPASVRAIAGWGNRPSGRRAALQAERAGLTCLRLEDGFLRSISPGRREPPSSIVVDDLGIYYDASVPSRLEAFIGSPLSPEQSERATRIAAGWRDGRLSKYHHARERAAPVDGPFVLAVDQTVGDASIRDGLASSSSFARMLEAALDEHPQAHVVLKIHPDVIAGRKAGHFGRMSSGAASRVTLLAADSHAPALLQQASAVYCVSSQMGFEALLWGKPVRTFGMPFYAGWGLTRDELPPTARRKPVPLEQLVHAALVRYARYLDPETGQACEVERLMDHFALQRRMRERFPETVAAASFSRWKKPIVRAFLAGSKVSFLQAAGQAPAGSALAVWGRRQVHSTASQVLRLEDGFMRSVGLGADLVRPISWVADDIGIYFDASAPSRLEQLLLQHEFDEALQLRARLLREQIVAARITKYNVGAASWQRPPVAGPVILVPGQVESDASIAWGAAGIGTNLGLLQAARRAEPHAYLVYKPHPDVLAGLRGNDSLSTQTPEAWRLLCDEVVTDANMGQLLDEVDAVHTITSLTGFEALMRGKRVVTWGLPFYAGWGLTEDRAAADPCLLRRRHRRLSLDELVAATLILYPTYLSRASGVFTTPERALQELQSWQRADAARPKGGAQHALPRRFLRAAAWLRER